MHLKYFIILVFLFQFKGNVFGQSKVQNQYSKLDLPKSIRIDSIQSISKNIITTKEEIESVEIIKLLRVVCRDEFIKLINNFDSTLNYTVQKTLVKISSNSNEKITAELIVIVNNNPKNENVFLNFSTDNILKNCSYGEFKTEYGFIALMNPKLNSSNSCYFIKYKNKQHKKFIQKFWNYN